jgi:hypothetical protein
METKTKQTKIKRDTKSLAIRRKRETVFDRFPSWLQPPVLILVGSMICIALLFPFTATVQVFDLPKEGDVAKETIIAPFTFDVMKEREELDRERKEAMQRVHLVVDYDKEIKKRAKSDFLELRKKIVKLAETGKNDSLNNDILMKLKRHLSDNTISTLVKRPYLIDDAQLQAEQMLNNGILAVLLIPSTERLKEIRAQYNTSFDRYLIYKKDYITLRKDSIESTVNRTEIPVKEIALENVIKSIKEKRRFDADALNTIYELLFVYVRPNVIVNGEETALRKQKAAQEVLPIKGKVVKDVEIVRKHQEVTEDIVVKLKALHAALQSLDNTGESRRKTANNAGRLLLVLVPFVFLGVYIQRFYPRLITQTNYLLALAAIVVFQIGIIRIGMLIVPRLFEGHSEITSMVPEYLIPVCLASILVAILFDLELSFAITVYIALYTGVVLNFKHSMILFTLLGGLVAAIVTKNIRYRIDFFKAIPPIVGTYSLIIIVWHLTLYRLSFLEIGQNLGLALINAILATFIAMVLVSVFEKFFDITTNMTLIELSDMNHPILKKLSIEAAGTYNHSVLVANLAESAAERIGANALLARVASYYHDIGKIEKADYFVENCLTGDKNRHNKLAPSMSALIISSHVKDGLELARKYKLPKVVQDAVLQHHGTSTVSFFYEKALEQDPHKQVNEEDFRYPGPRPQTRENAILMLADSVEAASRSLATSSPKLLRELVKKIIRDKFSSSQLDQCNLTLRDLDEIVEGFMPVLQGIFHSRIEYPQKES